MELLARDDLLAPEYAALIMPFGKCASYLNATVVRPLFEPGLKAAVNFVQNLSENQLKNKVRKNANVKYGLWGIGL